MTIEVEILAGRVKIGTASISAWDYSMGVAGGDFVASADYSGAAHATLMEGKRQHAPDAGRLNAYALNGELIECEVVAITDYAKTVGPTGREVEIFGLDLVRYFGPEQPAG